MIDKIIGNELQKIREELGEEAPQAIFLQRNGSFRRGEVERQEERAEEVPVIIGNSGLNSWEMESSEMEEEIND